MLYELRNESNARISGPYRAESAARHWARIAEHGVVMLWQIDGATGIATLIGDARA